jgi:hypothetical protein
MPRSSLATSFNPIGPIGSLSAESDVSPAAALDASPLLAPEPRGRLVASLLVCFGLGKTLSNDLSRAEPHTGSGSCWVAAACAYRADRLPNADLRAMGANKTFQQKATEDACSASPTSSSACAAQ